MNEQPKRTTLTPIGDELTPRETVTGKATLLERWQRRRALKESTQMVGGAVAWTAVRLVSTLIVAAAAGWGLAHLAHRRTSFGL